MSFSRVPGNMAWGQLCAGKETKQDNSISSSWRRAAHARLLHQAVGTVGIYEQGGSSLQS